MRVFYVTLAPWDILRDSGEMRVFYAPLPPFCHQLGDNVCTTDATVHVVLQFWGHLADFPRNFRSFADIFHTFADISAGPNKHLALLGGFLGALVHACLPEGRHLGRPPVSEA